MAKEKGFTLIEMMIVVIIIAILAAVAFPKFSSLIRQSQEARTKVNLAGIRAAIAMYMTDNGVSPTDDLQSLKPQYIQDIPLKYTPTFHPEGNTVSAGPLSAQTASTGDWFYVNDPTSSYYGTVFVNCVHRDLRGQVWTAY